MIKMKCIYVLFVNVQDQQESYSYCNCQISRLVRPFPCPVSIDKLYEACVWISDCQIKTTHTLTIVRKICHRGLMKFK